VLHLADPSDEPLTRLSRVRTDLSEDRTVLANERTFASWLRTGFAAIGIGLGFQALFNRLEPPWVPRSIASAFLAIAILIFIVAERRSRIVLARLKEHQVEGIGKQRMRLITFVSVVAAVALLAAIWLLRIAPPNN
jgi:putative membrane protein